MLVVTFKAQQNLENYKATSFFHYHLVHCIDYLNVLYCQMHEISRLTPKSSTLTARVSLVSRAI